MAPSAASPVSHLSHHRAAVAIAAAAAAAAGTVAVAVSVAVSEAAAATQAVAHLEKAAEGLHWRRVDR